jgi:cytochrome c biogenesis protein CcmG, thiol:disulfide interchange protein DsbE
MRLKLASVLALAASLVFAPNAQAQAAGEGSVSLPIGSQAPSVVLQDLDGNDVDLLRMIGGKPAVIEFWATWCEQCEALQPQIDRIQAQYGSQVQVVAIAVAVAQTVRRVQRHVADHNHAYPFLYDTRGAAVRAFQAPTTAVVVVLDADGKVAYTGVGAQQNLIGAVERVLGR